MKKVIRLTESELTNLIRKVVSEQTQPESFYVKKAEEILKKGPKPTEAGAKYCFTKEDLVKDIKNEGVQNIMLYKIKPGDSLSKLEDMTMQANHMYKFNHLCNLKAKNGLRANDVVLMSMLPSM
jgi:hypothetical protein